MMMGSGVCGMSISCTYTYGARRQMMKRNIFHLGGVRLTDSQLDKYEQRGGGDGGVRTSVGQMEIIKMCFRQ